MSKYNREKILEVIENYSRFIKKEDVEGIAQLFAEETYFHVYSTGSGAWDEKHAITRAEVKNLYIYFIKNIKKIEVTYTNYIVDEINNRLAFLVTANGENSNGTFFAMQNSVLLQLNAEYKITQFLNWYGIAPTSQTE